VLHPRLSFSFGLRVDSLRHRARRRLFQTPAPAVQEQGKDRRVSGWLRRFGQVEIVVACPGRLLDLMKTHKKIVNLKSLAYLVIDEADKVEPSTDDRLRTLIPMLLDV
jgi:hypothetical protein